MCAIVSATHQDLKEMIRHGRFREDLFYRLNVIPIRLPPLRQRLDDLPLLVEHFLEENRLKTGKNIDGITNEAMDRLSAYHWPGNVRELINALEYAFVVCKGDYVNVTHLPENIAPIKRPQRPGNSTRRGSRTNKIDRVLQAMRHANGKKSEAARLLGITRQALWKKIKKLGIEWDDAIGETGDRL